MSMTVSCVRPVPSIAGRESLQCKGEPGKSMSTVQSVARQAFQSFCKTLMWIGKLIIIGAVGNLIISQLAPNASIASSALISFGFGAVLELSFFIGQKVIGHCFIEKSNQEK